MNSKDIIRQKESFKWPKAVGDVAEYRFSTEGPLATNADSLYVYLCECNMLDITHEERNYAEGMNQKGEVYSLTAKGDGDFCNHVIVITRIE